MKTPAVSGSAPVTVPAGIDVSTPTGRQRVYFERALDTFHLHDAARDGRLTEDELRSVGLSLESVRQVAATHGNVSHLDDYLEIVRLGGGYSLPSDRLLDPKRSGDYVIFAPKHLQPALRTLCAHRANDGRTPVTIDPEDVYALYGSMGPEVLARYLRDAKAVWAEPKPKFVLLVGAPDGAVAHESSMKQTYLSDARLGKGLLVGRLPFGDPDSLQNYVHGLIDQEARVAPGAWQLSATIYDGDPMWGGTAARWIDRFTSWQLSVGAPDDHIVRRYSDNPSADRGVREYREELRSALLVNYIGHGGGDVFAVFGNSTEGFVKPLIVSAACSDAREGEWSAAGQLIATGAGLAAIAALVDTHPLPNLLFSEAIAKETMNGRETVGELLEAARADVREKRGGFLSHLVLLGYLFARIGLAIARLFGKKSSVAFPSSKTLAREHAELYTIFGDPAARLRQPVVLKKLTLPPRMRVGQGTQVSVALPPAFQKLPHAFVWLETRDAHDAKLVARIPVRIVDGKLAPFRVPNDVKPGHYRLRVIVQNETDIATAAANDILVMR